MQQGGSQYGIPGLPLQPQQPSLPDLIAAAEARGISCGMMGILGSGGDSSVSAVNMRAQTRSSSGFEELTRARFGEEEEFVGEEGDRGLAGNRWPRQETLALLKIRSDMNATFSDAIVKGPLWEDISRKLAELGYHRTAKKCKEKFENVHKYYKRTKEGRAGRQDGKSYRFFSQLEALNNPHTSNPPPLNPNPAANSDGNFKIPVTTPPAQPTTSNSEKPTKIETPPPHQTINTDFTTGIRFFSDSSSGEESGNPTEDYSNTGKRKRPHQSSTKKIMTRLESLMNQVIQKQETLQQRFLEAIEKREQEQMIREESWKRQAMARLSREQDIIMQERSITASRDATVIGFLQKITGQTMQIPPEKAHPKKPMDVESSQMATVSLYEQDTAATAGVAIGIFDPASSRWPKSEVLALIELRNGLETKYQEANPKGPLWEEISLAMKNLGYNRSTKRCKEKWENINKYFKKVKESNKRRPEDAKTCPYYHQLDAIYKMKMNEKKDGKTSPIMPVPASESENTNQKTSNSGNPMFFLGNDKANQPEDLVKEMMNRIKDYHHHHHHQQQQQSVMDDCHSENLERTQEDEEDDIEDDGNDDGEGSRKVGYEVQYEISTNPSTLEASSFMAMVQ